MPLRCCVAPTGRLVDGHVIRPSFHIEPLEPGARVPNVARWLGRVGLEAAVTASSRSRHAPLLRPLYARSGSRASRPGRTAVLDLGASLDLGGSGSVLDLELQNVFDTKYPEIRASGFINPGMPRTLRAAVRFAA